MALGRFEVNTLRGFLEPLNQRPARKPHSCNPVSQDLKSGSKIVLLITWVIIFLEEPD
jgi:hypothetical protein